MGYPDGLLAEGEYVVVHKHPHWKMLVLPVLAFVLIVVICVFLAGLVAGQSWANYGWIAIAALGGVLLIWLALIPLLRWRTTHFVVTSRRVIVREGILHRSGIDIPMTRINSVQFRHTLVERLLGCGTLIVESASDEPLEFEDIPRVEKVHSLLYHEIHAEHDTEPRYQDPGRPDPRYPDPRYPDPRYQR